MQDMFEAIEKGDYPVWNVYVQVMDPKEAENYKWNIFDMTKVWPHHDFPLRQIGKLTLNRNVSYTIVSWNISFQLTSKPSHGIISPISNRQPFLHRIWFPDSHLLLILVRAFLIIYLIKQWLISFSTVLQARMFAYPDAARYRLGTNYQMLPTNAAHAPVYCPYQRDGFMNFSTNYGDDPNYVGSSLKPTTFAKSSSGKPPSSTITEHEKWVGEVCTFASTIEHEDFEQATALWKVLGRDPGHQDRYIDNVSKNIKNVTSKELREKVYSMWYRPF